MMAASGVLSGRYEIGDRLGSGGMSSVHQATDLILERTVAVKILAEHLSDDERFVARFRREALAVAKLIHPNIVQVYDTGIDEGRHYIVMEYVQGRSGAQILQRQGPLDAETTAEIGAQACAGLDYAHRRGIIHRDVKPGNLMVTGGPVGGGEMTIKLTDFGIARAVEQTRITQVGSVVGTAAYLSPEQVRGEEATPATDVYALGVVLYQFLTGRLPYEGSTLAELAVRQQNEKPLPPSAYNDDVPETLGAAVLRALEGDPNRRYASASELAGGLVLGLQGEDVTLPLEEGTAATNVLGSETGTRRLDQTAQTEYRPAQPSPTRRPVPRAPRQQPAPPMPVPPQAKRKRSAFSRFARFVLALVALVLIAAAVAAAVIYTTDKATGVKATEVAGNTVDKVVEEFKDLVKKNSE
jgi:serine/threonine-protein kinase